MFSQKNRLAKRTDVNFVYTRGRAFFSQFFTVKFLNRSVPNSRFTVVVSTKVSKKATKRNSMKRQLREYVRTHITYLKTGDYIIIVKPLAAKLENKELREELEKLWIKAKLLDKAPNV